MKRRIDDPEVLKALAHPFRARILGALERLGPVTVGELTRHVGGDPGQVSYHLRELAKRGFVEDVPELARDRRERWVRAVQEDWGWSSADFQTPEGKSIAHTVYAHFVIDQFERLRHYARTAEEDWPEWEESATSHQSHFQLTIDELRELVADLHQALTPWVELSRKRLDSGESPEGAEPITFFYHAFPDKP